MMLLLTEGDSAQPQERVPPSAAFSTVAVTELVVRTSSTTL